MDLQDEKTDGRQRLLAVAESLFTERGFRAVSIRDIAQACELTNAALYYHFPNKAALFHEVMERHAEHIARRMRSAAEGEQTPRGRLEAILKAYALLTTEHRAAFFNMRREAAEAGEPGGKDQHGRLMQAMLAPVEEAIEEAVASGELRPPDGQASLAAMLFGMLHGLALYRKAREAQDISEEDVTAIVDLFWRGLS